MAFDPLSLGITGLGFLGQGIATGIAQAVESQRPENRMTQQQYIDYSVGGSMRDAARRGNQMERVARAGANKNIASRSQYLPSLGGDFSLVSPERMRALRRASAMTTRAQQQGLAQGAIGDKAQRQQQSAQRVAGVAGASGALASTFAPEIDTGTKALGKINIGQTLLPMTSGLLGETSAMELQRNNRRDLLGGTGLYGQNPYNLGYG